jgi:hypothetical protein
MKSITIFEFYIKIASFLNKLLLFDLRIKNQDLYNFNIINVEFQNDTINYSFNCKEKYMFLF